MQGDKNVSNPNEIANSFNKYFTSIADDILKKRKYEGHTSFREYLLNSMNQSFVIYNCHKDDIKNIIPSYNINKGNGPNIYSSTFKRGN